MVINSKIPFMNQDKILLSSIWRSGIVAAGLVVSLELPAIAEVQTSLGQSFAFYSTIKTQQTNSSLYSYSLYDTTSGIDSPTLYARKHGKKKRHVAPPPPMPEIQLSPEAQRILCEQFPLNSRCGNPPPRARVRRPPPPSDYSRSKPKKNFIVIWQTIADCVAKTC